ncbi:C4-dicarboxylate-binding periplasmic protein precursor (plasmid) [Sulfitobacter sp. THAF37]|nr:C4-dicarboxylate-binding periplasmic protein precursor [Sulfitobacter sp. THAF37]
MKYFGRITSSVMAATISLAVAGGAQSEEVLRFGSGQANDSPLYQLTYKKWVDAINEEADGEMTITNFPPPFATATNTWERVVQGVADIGVAGLPISGIPLEKTLVTTLPSTEVTDMKAASMALAETYEKGLLDDSLEEVKILAIYTVLPTRFYSREPISDVEQLKGMKVRAQDANMVKAMSKLGAAAVSIPFSEGYQAISRGVVEASSGNEITQYTYKWSDYLKHGIEDITFGMTPFAIIMNKDKYESLSPEMKAIIDKNSGLALTEMMATAQTGIQQKFSDEMVADGRLTWHKLSPEQFEIWKAAISPVVEEWLENGDGVQETYDAFMESYEANLK